LVILHEEAEEGKIIEDLTGPVAAVGAAVKNLVEVRISLAIYSKYIHVGVAGHICSVVEKFNRVYVLIHTQ
jgi:hypothetical protein